MYGKFIKETAGYEINTFKLPASWEYIYENRDVLLKVDQYGPVYAQAYPPGDVMMFKREQHQKYSPWLFRISSEDFSGSFSNFYAPNSYDLKEEAKNVSIKYLPESAMYYFEYNGLAVKTEFIIPEKGVTVVCNFKVKNISDRKMRLNISSHLVPYFNEAQMAPWDKYEWYIDSEFDEKNILFDTILLNANANGKEKRHMQFKSENNGVVSNEVSYEKYVGCGDIIKPEMNFTNSKRIYGYPPIYALKYVWELEAGEEQKITQILTIEKNIDEKYFDVKYFDEKRLERKEEFNKLFSKNVVKTGDEQFDYYANYWLPLQMDWVASLDRGWPTGMRGSRDSAQDYTGLLYTKPEKCREIILTMMECQRSDGWFPRQYSAKGKHGKHDLRGHVDGGAFFVEFMWKYLAHTHDFDILDLKIEWLDKDNESTVLEHLIQAAEYYIKDENIGEHGLCKIREGDWLDAVNRAGLEGRGESVTVSEQMVMGLKYLADILNHINYNGDIQKYLDFAEKLKNDINKYAYNKDGFYNGVFNDNGEWIFSDKDPDGKKRIYGVSNYYAVISGVADENKYESILNVAEQLKCDKGYRLFNPYLGEKPIDKVGRVASGDVPPYLGENANVYNHGSQGFLARALSVMNEGNKLFDVLKWITPYDTDKHPTKKTFTPPYAIVNCYQQLPEFDHRGLMCFLTGSVAMAVRGVYEHMIGLKPCLDGIEISPCLPDTMTDVNYTFEFNDKMHSIRIVDNNDIYFDGEKINTTCIDFITGKKVCFVNL